MPQLDTIYTFMVFIWTWSMLYLLGQKIKTTLITKTPKNPPHYKTNKPTTLPWT